MYIPSQTLQTAMAAGNPQRVLLEFVERDTSITETFSNEDIAISEGLRLTRPFNTEEELTIGSCPSAEIEFSLLNANQQLADFTFGDCRVWIGYRIDSGTPGSEAKTAVFEEDGVNKTYEFVPLGVFNIERPDIVKRDILQVRGYDRMTLFDKEMPSREELGLEEQETITIKMLLEKMCLNVGVTLATTSFLNDDLEIGDWPTRYFDSKTMREVLRWIAEAAGSIARFNRDGQLEIAWFQAYNSVTYDEHSYSDFVQTWYQVAPIDGLKVRNQQETDESSYPPDTEFENPYLIVGNPFLR